MYSFTDNGLDSETESTALITCS